MKTICVFLVVMLVLGAASAELEEEARQVVDELINKRCNPKGSFCTKNNNCCNYPPKCSWAFKCTS